MDTESMLIAAAIYALWIILEIVQFPTSGENRSLHLMSVGSNTIAAMLILATFYTGDWILLLLLGIVCLPFGLYNWYQTYREDKKRLAINFSLITLFIAATWLAHYF